MVLDLAVKAAEHEGGKRATADIPGRDHLPAGEADRRCGFDDRHSLVVGRETDAQVQREDRLLHRDEGECLERRENQQHHRQVQRGMQHYERDFYHRGTVPSPQQPFDSEYVHATASQQHEGEEERRLPARQPRCERAALVFRPVRRGLGDSFAHVGVAAHLVGVRMVSVVLGHPPAKAQPDERVRHGKAEHVIVPARAENLVVPGIVADEAQLREHHPQQWGDGEGRPRVADHDEKGPASEEGEDRQGDLHPVVAGPAVEQAHRSYLPRQCAKASGRRIDGSRQPLCS
jgi:hypothetical protein